MLRRSILTVPVALIAAMSVLTASAASAAQIEFNHFDQSQVLSADGQTFTDVGGVPGLNVNVKASGTFNADMPTASGEHNDVLDNHTSAQSANTFTLTFSHPVNIKVTSTDDNLYSGASGREKVTLSANAGGVFTADDDADDGFEGSGQTIITKDHYYAGTLSAQGTNITSFTWDYDDAVSAAARQPLRVKIVEIGSEPASAGPANTAGAAVRLPAMFSDHMVLQRGAEIPVWGWADPGEKIAVSFAGHQVVATANDQGQWSVKLPSMKADAQGRDLTITSDGKTLTIHDVLVGEVWLCSGQSNMEYPINGQRYRNHYKQVIPQANHPTIRLINVPNVPAGTPQRNFRGKWLVCSPKTVSTYSAVGYFFALNLQQKLHVPIGLLEADWGGTRIETWMPRQAFNNAPKLKKDLDQLKHNHARWRSKKINYMHAIESWITQAKSAAAKDAHIPDPPQQPRNLIQAHVQAPAALFNGMISPLIPYRIRGAIWYQGESNALEHDRVYFYHLKAMIDAWRSLWNQGDFPFIIAQIAPYGGYAPGDEQAIWQGQIRAARELKNVGIASTMDIGDLHSFHPKDKQDVGKRLALWAFANVYGDKNVVYSGPMFASMQIQNGKAIIHYIHVGSGLAMRDGKPLTWFEVAGASGKFVKASAKIQNDRVIVWSPRVNDPKAVRFAWSNVAVPSFMNKEGLPALPFNTAD